MTIHKKEDRDTGRRITLVLMQYDFRSEISLDEIKESLFGIGAITEANRKASNDELPVRFYRHGSSRSPYYCSSLSLAEYIVQKQLSEEAEFRRAKGAGAAQ